jgi:glucose-6-phosphate 1-dehydrogenase
VVEKPFGRDLQSARALNARLLLCMHEDQIYRIDHFLGKETVRNIIAVRFGNDLFEPVWNRSHIDSVQITAAETVGVEDRGAYYDGAGALRDMVASHLCQLVGMIAMEPPNLFDPAAVRAERGRAVAAIRKVGPKEAAGNLAAGQYDAGEVGRRAVNAYSTAPRVDPDSRTETFAAVRLWIDNRRWAGVPFYLRTGKALCARNTEIALRFKAVAGRPGGAPPRPNVLVLRVQPNEGVSLLIEAKRPGPDAELAPVSMDFRFADHFSGNLGTGYESLIYDALIGDPTLFTRGQDVEAAWAAIDPFIALLESGARPEPYAAGSAGPLGADTLIERDGREWRPVKG